MARAVSISLSSVYDRVGNIMMTRLMGADSRVVDDGFDIGIR